MTVRQAWREAQQRSRLTTVEQRLRFSLTMGVSMQYARTGTSEVVRNSVVERETLTTSRIGDHSKKCGIGKKLVVTIRVA